MNGDGNGDKELLELNYQLRGEQKRVKDGVAGEEHVSAEDDELNVNGTAKDVNDGNGGSVHAATVLKIPQQPPLNAMVCWERFLHIRSLKVLLVENDDSTRHVVAALLRNCSYDVIEAANGVQAWRILEDLTNHIDLVLTEVVMPCVSGVSLLCKIMSHKTRRNIPVIMMSSHDSMGLVFKCLSKGAVDFLVKPIRKNELKNLWQHVWRRCHSSSGSGSGSGSESGTQTQKSVKTKSVEKSDNNSGSNDEDDNGSVGLNVGDGSDDGSGTQSSWTKQAVEVDSPRPELPHDRVPECPDSTCAQVIHSNAEASGNKGMPLTATREFPEHEEQLDIGGGFPRNVDLQLESRIEVPIKTVGTEKTNQLDTGSSNFNEHIDKRDLDLNSVSASSKLRSEAANLTSITTNTTDIEKTSAECDAPYRVSKILDGNDKIIEDNKELPSLELGLKRLRGVKDVGTAVGDERNVLRRSDSSAFSRYNASSNTNKLSDGNIGSTSAVDNSLEVTRKGLASDIRSQSVNNPPNQSSNNVGSNNIDMDSTTNNAFINPVGMKNNSSPSTVKISHPSATLQSLENDLSCAPQNIVSKKADDGTATGVLTHPAGPYQDLQIDHLQHHYDHHLHLSHKNPQKQTPAEDDDMSLRKMAIAAPHCGSSNVLGGPFEGNTGNYSVNGSASGSNYGSNGPNGSSTAVNTGGTNIESDNGIAGKSGSGDASGSGSGSGNRVDQDKSHRAAALTKFRQKRKERCFRKKVRYQSRQRIAEQRPRVRGQFAHLTGNEGTSRATDD